jgi:KaiC/GvpD/RAD55 family RecA-like ATPase
MKYPFGDNFQLGVIKFLVERKNLSFLDRLDESLFDSVSLKILFKSIKYYTKKYLSFPSYESLEFTCGGIYLKDSEFSDLKKEIIEKIQEIKNLEIDLDEIKKLLEEFIKAQSLRKLFLEMTDDFNAGNYSKIEKYIRELAMLSKLDEESNQIFYSKSFEKKIEVKEKISTGFQTLDEWLDGGIEKGELGIFLGQAAVGKSLMLINLIPKSLGEGKNILYLTFEISKEHIKQRLDSLLADLSIRQVRNQGENLKPFILSKVKGELVIREYAPFSVSVFGIKGCLEELKILYNLDIDLLLVDSLVHIRPSIVVEEDWRNVGSIVNELRGLARENGLAVWTVAHVTRNAFFEDFEASDTARSIELVNAADLIFGLVVKKGDSGVIYLKPLKLRREEQPSKKLELLVNYRKAKIEEKI